MKPSCDKNPEAAAARKSKAGAGKQRTVRAAADGDIGGPPGDPRGPGSARQPEPGSNLR